MKRLIRFVLLLVGATVVFSDVPPNRSQVQAAGGCICSGQATVYLGEHTLENRRGVASDYDNIGVMGSQWQCADMCQAWVLDVLGAPLCDYHNIGETATGEGGVDIDWYWYYAGTNPWSHGHLVQGYDCYHLLH